MITILWMQCIFGQKMNLLITTIKKMLDSIEEEEVTIIANDIFPANVPDQEIKKVLENSGDLR